MKYLHPKSCFLALLILAISACNSTAERQAGSEEINPQKLKESLENVNKNLVREESARIDSYAKRHGLETTKTGTGLQFMITEHGQGDSIKKGDLVRFSYVTKLLTGEIIYSSETSGIRQFVVGRGGVEAGLEEAVLLLKHGDAAVIILPSHLAFGLLGDQNKIPSRSSIIYEVKILEN